MDANRRQNVDSSKEVKEILSPLKSIRTFCLGCVGNVPSEVKMCPSTKCPLYPYRFGKDVRQTGRKRSPAQIEAFNKMMEEKRKKNEKV